MQDHDAARRLPVSGDMGVIPGSNGPQEQYVYASREQHESQRGNARILLVEDDASLAALAAEVLTAQGYTVVSVASGEIAIALLRTFVPDLVVLDLELTGALTGLDVLQALRSYATIPVLFTTSSVTAARRYARHTGESRLTLDHLPKPYSIPTLLKRVERMLIASMSFD